MKIINLCILAHFDAGKTTLTESLLYTSGAIAELGSVDKGTTRTDTMNLERQRGDVYKRQLLKMLLSKHCPILKGIIEKWYLRICFYQV